MPANDTLYESQTQKISRRVFYEGSDALLRGLGMCYNRDYTVSGGAATDNEGRRDKRVERPTNANSRNFAGVVDQGYDAVTGGQWIIIYEPGSVADVAIGDDVVINTGIITCSCSVGDSGRFVLGGLPGRGSAVPLQTNASGTLASVKLGTASDAFDTTGLILTVSGSTGALAVDDDIYIVAGEDDNTNSVTPTAGPHKITAIVADTTITIGTAQSDGGTMEASWYGMSGNQTALCYLQDGPGESGLHQWVQITNGASATVTPTGMTFIHAGGAAAGANTTTTLADAYPGELKGYFMKGLPTTEDYVVTITNGDQFDGTTALATLTFDADTDLSLLRMGIDRWRHIETGPTTAGPAIA